MTLRDKSGEIVTGFFDYLKRTEPIGFALIALSFALLWLLYIQSSQFTMQRRENVALFIQMQKDVQNLLVQCHLKPPQ